MCGSAFFPSLRQSVLKVEERVVVDCRRLSSKQVGGNAAGVAGECREQQIYRAPRPRCHKGRHGLHLIGGGEKCLPRSRPS